MSKEIISAIESAPKNKKGALCMTPQIKAVLLEADARGALSLTRHNENYFSLQGVYSTVMLLIKGASHFEMIDDRTIMLKSGGKKLRALKF